MGAGNFDANLYHTAATSRRMSGVPDFGYSDAMVTTTPPTEWTAHPDLEVNGVGIREARDSVDHPLAVPVAVWFDVTGSMTSIPSVLQQKLPFLLDHILQNGVLQDPQIAFGAIGDATKHDPVPVQFSQFESDNRMDDQLRNILLVGGGGGGGDESYELALYFMARHTAHDHFDVRGKRGYCFLIGDEFAYKQVVARQVQNIFGDGIQADIKFADILAEVQRMWEVYFILPQNAAHGFDVKTVNFWKDHLASNFLEVPTVDDIVDVLGTTIAANEIVVANTP